MSPNVAFAAQHVPFDAAQYTWIDLLDVPRVPMEEKREHFAKRGINPDAAMSFTELSLPFEKFALIPPEIDYDKGSVLTVERTSEKMTIIGWQMGRDAANFVAELRPSEDNDQRDVMSVRYDPRLPVAKRGPEVARRLYLDSMKTLISHIQCFSAGVYGQTRDTYQCTGDAAVNEKRKKKHKKPLYDWHTVVVQTVRAEGESKGGTHATPRQHEVRGHYVRSKLGKVFWRKSHKRGDPTLGVIFHDYTTETKEVSA